MDDSTDSEDLFSKLQEFSKINEQFLIAFKLTERNPDISRTQKNDLHLHYVAQNILSNPEYLPDAINSLSKFLPKLASIAITFNEKTNPFSYARHVNNCVLLGKLIQHQPDLVWLSNKYFEDYPSPFKESLEGNAKRRKMAKITPDLDLVESCYVLLKSNPKLYRDKWEWSVFVKYLDHENKAVQWIACHCIFLVTGMTEQQLSDLIDSKMSRELHHEFTCMYNFTKALKPDGKTSTSIDQHPHVSSEKTDSVVEVSGCYLPKLPDSPSRKNDLIVVESTHNNLRKIAMGLMGGKAVCLQGPVGSGKTSLVEYLASRTGRELGRSFVKVQLGDQTDSKMLLGTYRCTDIPGEFVWQPGVITQAILEGHWLLLEDVDTASMDIASVLSSLLENGGLTISGFSGSLSITPGFQLFFTQRLVSTITGDHRKHSSAMSILDKHLLQITVDPLTSDELKQIVTNRHPQFSTIADRMLGVFHIFTKDRASSEMSLPKTSRLISTRDFFKWCSRASLDFDVKSQASALKVLQDAIDVFCCSFPKPEDALNLAKEISSHLGIIHEKAMFFFKSYKPNMQLTSGGLTVGRASLRRNNEAGVQHLKYYFTRPSSVLLERIMCCVGLKEPVLLVGETGTGKTSTVQYLANAIGQKLVVINMNQQSDSADLLGGFKPVDLKFVVNPIRREFEHLFGDLFQVEANKKFLGHVSYCYNEQRWSDLVALMRKSQEAAVSRLRNSDRKFRWQALGEKLEKLSLQLKQKTALAFSFIEGSLVRAVERGHWVLLDEINLANAETLECLSGLLEGSEGSLCLLERGDRQPVERHPNFTLFACMNPSTDVGKKDLPAGLRNRFTEFFVEELTEKSDLLLLTANYLNALSLKDSDLEKIVSFYLTVRKETETSLTDGLGHKPHFSLRSLCRALTVTARNPCGMLKKSLYEAFCLSFLTQLDAASYKSVEKMIAKFLIGDEKSLKAVVKQPIPEPKSLDGQYLQFEGYWIRKGSLEGAVPDDYILTESVRKNLKDLVRIVSIGGLPVLLQGDTSVGKTSLITYLAKSSGNRCVRINNHEHTDLQEYIGSYAADPDGRLVFREGVLVEAMRRGHWIILDELNLAPTDVLEALNRVLDDNRELFIPETQETVKADPNFMLFATQNPPGSYGGRKMLSRAFRNRFVELHFNEIPPLELQFILHKRCQMPPSYAKKMIGVMTDLQTRRRGSAAFAGKQGFITLRDLFRWGERYRLAQTTDKLHDWDQHLADEGYLVLAGRVRRTEEKKEIIEVLEKHLKRKVEPVHLFTLSDRCSIVTKSILTGIQQNGNKFPNIVWTYNMRQLAVLVAKAFQFKEPVLLVGETGGGKTTVCRVIAEQNGQDLVTVNCHMHTESSDFIGGLRPVRDHSSDDINKLFEWMDGPLIKAMVKGDVFLADEISLADDSVLERLNSLLEPERSMLLAEKGTDLNNPNNSELIVANDGFYFIGTMNPGGDFGKKELSPALRNRFTEIWCESCTDRSDLVEIIERNVREGISFGNQQDGTTGIGTSVMDFIEYLKSTDIGKKLTISIRDILTWVDFINVCGKRIDVFEAYLHGAFLTFLDGLGSGITGSESLRNLERFKDFCQTFLKNQLKSFTNVNYDIHRTDLKLERSGRDFGINPFYIKIGDDLDKENDFTFNAPTTIFNTLRLLRGMQLHKAILLEGSPGVGKTSLVTALAKFTRRKIFRVNLSDQTDISDLFGADLPVEGGTGGQFSWRDGPLLQALKQGHWILLDELNLASQSVLEGLNACLDHRGEIFIPELGKTFHVKPGTRFFACQNPLKQGGSRRGLPQSFLNRFIQVHVTCLTDEDMTLILNDQFPQLPPSILTKMIEFNSLILANLETHTFANKGSPWEFNLRDLTRWCEATIYHFAKNPDEDKCYQPENLVQLIYSDRLRTSTDRTKLAELFEGVFGRGVSGDGPVLYVNGAEVFVGDVSFAKNGREFDSGGSSLVLRSQLPVLRSLLYCVNLGWMSLLVGSSGSGKSAVVRALADLTGACLKTLPVTAAMDTTDILGGFEQTDYTRHLEELLKETERILFEAVRTELIKGAPCDRLLGQWEGYKNLNGTNPKRTMQEEGQLFLKKLDKLEIIWDNLCGNENFKRHSSVRKMREKSLKMRESIKIEGSLNAGGKFEWVDSVLIKCLQEGSWLLVDNVNLCSAAVLDRLNALLEPHGVLTVGERGINEHGKMVEITPHPDFRLFLTMDPKNGEISRAMRNRGVEIYMLNQNEKPRNELDLKSLINREGLKNFSHINTLLSLHDYVSELILGEKPNINQILRAANLISQEIRNGSSIFEAFASSLLEIYYKTRSPLEFNCNDFKGVLNHEIRRVLSLKSEENYCENMTLKTDNLHICANLEKIKQQGALLQISRKKYFLIFFYSSTSLEDLQLRHLYCTKLIGDNEISNSLFEFLRKSKIDYSNLPVDCSWLPETIFLNRNVNSSNLVALGLHFTANLTEENVTVSRTEEKKKKPMTLYNYMKKRHERKIDEQFDDVLAENLLKLTSEFDRSVIKVINDKNVTINYNDSVSILQLLTWRFILTRSTSVNVKNITNIERNLILTNLKVHYGWFLKYSVKKLGEILKIDLTGLEIFRKVNESLENHFSDLHKICRNYQKWNEKPAPRISENEIAVSMKLQELVKKFNISNRDIKGQIINLFMTDDENVRIDAIKSLEEKELVAAKLDQYELEIMPLIDYFFKLKVVKTILEEESEVDEIKTSLVVPVELAAAISCVSFKQDPRLRHWLMKAFFDYLPNSASVNFGSFYNFEEERTLSRINPLLLTHVTLLLLQNDGAVKFGNFQQLRRQHRQLNLLLWRNFHQINSEDYDFLGQETRLLRESFTRFAGELSRSLGLPTDLQLCLGKLESLSGKELNRSFVSHLRSCSEVFAEIGELTDFDERAFLVSKMHMELSYVKIILNSRLALIDPSAKKALKKKYCVESIGSFGDLRDALRSLNEVYSGERGTLHPHCGPVEGMIEELRVKGEKLGGYVAVRPRDVPYEEVVKAVNRGFSTILSCQYVDRIIQTLDVSIKDLIKSTSPRKDIAANFKHPESAVASYENLLSEWTRFQPSYPDVMEPLLADLSQFLYGLKSSLAVLKKLQNKLPADARRRLADLVRVPGLSDDRNRYEAVIDSYTDKNFQEFVSHVFADEGSKSEVLRLFKCGIQESFNNCVIKSGQETFSHFENLIKGFVDAWNRQEEDRVVREKEADSLYKTKTKCDDKSEEEQEQDELKELFPNYHDRDFADFQDAKLSADPETEAEKTSFSGLISEEDIKFVSRLHLTLVQSFTRSEWLNPERNKSCVPDFLLPLIEKYKLFRRICEKTIHGLDCRLDKELVESLNVLVSFVQSYGDPVNLVEQPSPSRILQNNRSDFYKDSNVEEVKASFHILEGLKLKVRELLEEWPDQPTLKTILEVIERIYNFEITSPLSRFLTGFELLLSKCNEWEQVAHSGVSLSQVSQDITHQIIEWRKMELNVWKDLLNIAFNRLNDPVLKSWIYLFNVMEQFASGEKLAEIELIETLQNYVTRSNLAEFQGRLNLLHAFHCHAVRLERSRKSDAFLRVLWNLHSYFQQFAANVSNRIRDLRAPIEKKLKDYVKIVRWKDVNYWAIKETVDKSHRTLHKYVKEFQDVLRQPVAPCLVNFDNGARVENVGIWDRPQRSAVKTYHYTLDPSTYVGKETLKKKINQDSSAPDEQLSHKLESCFAGARKLCKDSISAMKYPKLVQSLDNFVSQVIETSAHLQSLEVDTTLPKNKQKSHAKSILQQKHRALADLFKNLSKIGVSFKSGIVESKLKMLAEDFLIKPLDLNANFSHINCRKMSEKILTIWDGCEMYYLRSSMRADVLDTALKTPAPDLGLQNIDRCRGFSSNLLTLIQKQKKDLTESSLLFYYLRHYATQMTRLCDSDQLLPIEQVEKAQEIMANIKIVITQTKVILNSCPEEETLNSETCEVIILKPEPSHWIRFRNDPLWDRASGLMADIQNLASRISSDFEKTKGFLPATEFVVVPLKFVPVNDLSGIENKIEDLLKCFADLVLIFEGLKTCESLKWLISEVEQLKTNLKTETEIKTSKNSKQIPKLVEDLAEVISSSLQNISSKHESNTIESEEEEELAIQEEHLKQLLISDLESDLQLLDMKKILDFCQRISEIFFCSPVEKNKAAISLIVPLLEQAILLHQYFLTQQVSAYRVSCKMTSILLNIFIELTSKGFCVPPELAEGDEEGVGKPSDGLGLGEGQGERDVSDKIESEDQLDDAQPAGQEKQDEDKDLKEEEKGIEMSDDFESKLQDVDRKEDESENSDSGDEQMGETEDNSNKQDKETFGSDEENLEEGEGEEKEETGDSGEKEGESQLAAKNKEQNKTDDQDENGKEKEEKKREINEMEEPEYDDEQTDPYHGNQPELPEPEAMDLPEDLQLDEGQENDNAEDQNEENPFDIDNMKEDNPFEEPDKENGDENPEEEGSEKDYSSEDEEITKTNDERPAEDNKKETNEVNESEKEEEKTSEESGIDQTQTNEDNVEAMQVDNTESSDKTQPNQAETQKSSQPIEEVCQEDKPDKEGVGQSQMEESSTGHTAQTTLPQDIQSSKRPREEELNRKQKPGESEDTRTLGNTNEPVKKKLKTIDSKEDDVDEEGEEASEENEAEMFKHIKEAKEASTQVLDVATKEQAEEQRHAIPIPDEEEEKPEESSETLPVEEEEKIESVDDAIKKPEKTEGRKNEKKTQKQHSEGDILEEINEVDIEGQFIDTTDVRRGVDSSHHTMYDDLKNFSANRLTPEEVSTLRSEVETQLSSWIQKPTDAEADGTWQKISSMTSSLAQDLSEQLRLVLEPTQASRLKGDFRTGRRINMRKVIPYIASQFRKDKIWLRRTKPSKREYQIVLAIDDSSSMADNRSKELAFESVALISKALTLLESGQLSVLSFGEDTEILHRLTDQFTERSGANLLQKFGFDQNKTCVAKLVDFVTEMFAQSQIQTNALNAKLLVIVSDGRGVFSEGENYVRQAVRRARLGGIFMVFVIIDNPENKNSILDIRKANFKDGKCEIESYMDAFPFSFYIILRDINSLPSVLSDALRQWFEVVSNLDKQ